MTAHPNLRPDTPRPKRVVGDFPLNYFRELVFLSQPSNVAVFLYAVSQLLRRRSGL